MNSETLFDLRVDDRGRTGQDEQNRETSESASCHRNLSVSRARTRARIPVVRKYSILLMFPALELINEPRGFSALAPFRVRSVRS